MVSLSPSSRNLVISKTSQPRPLVFPRPHTKYVSLSSYSLRALYRHVNAVFARVSAHARTHATKNIAGQYTLRSLKRHPRSRKSNIPCPQLRGLFPHRTAVERVERCSDAAVSSKYLIGLWRETRRTHGAILKIIHSSANNALFTRPSLLLHSTLPHSSNDDLQ